MFDIFTQTLRQPLYIYAPTPLTDFFAEKLTEAEP